MTWSTWDVASWPTCAIRQYSHRSFARSRTRRCKETGIRPVLGGFSTNAGQLRDQPSWKTPRRHRTRQPITDPLSDRDMRLPERLSSVLERLSCLSKRLSRLSKPSKALVRAGGLVTRSVRAKRGVERDREDPGREATPRCEASRREARSASGGTRNPGGDGEDPGREATPRCEASRREARSASGGTRTPTRLSTGT